MIARATMDQRQLRTAFAAFATGVTVVTVGGETPHGMTANSFTSVSLDPPLILICVDLSARMHRLLSRADGFAVSVLAAGQEAVARHFASNGRPAGQAEFDDIAWSPGGHTGAPLIGGALAWFECARRGNYDGGDHSIFIGRLVSAVRRDGVPLLFFDRAFRHLEGKEPG